MAPQLPCVSMHREISMGAWSEGSSSGSGLTIDWTQRKMPGHCYLGPDPRYQLLTMCVDVQMYVFHGLIYTDPQQSQRSKCIV
jgi:hypothetical protein